MTTYNDNILGSPVTFPLVLNGMVIDYVLQVPIDADILRSNLYGMVGYSRLAQTLLGTGISNATLAVNLACTPVSPGGLQVVIGYGAIYQYVNYLEVNYGVINADSNANHNLLKQGILFDPVTLNTPAPSGGGNSIIYLIEAAYSEVATNSVSRPYFDPTNPTNPTYTSANDTLSSAISLVVKAGTPSSSPVAPTPDAGYIPLYYVQVANGQTVIVSGNISVASGAPFITESLTQKISQATADTRYAQATSVQANAYNYSNDTGTANNYVATISPVPGSYATGTSILLKVLHTNTGSSNINVNSLGNKTILLADSTPLTGGEILADMVALLVYDGTEFRLMNPVSNNELDTLKPGMILPYAGGTVQAGFLPCDGSAVSRTTYANLFAAIGTTWGVGDGSTTFNVPQSARSTLVGSGGTGTAELGNAVGDTGGEESHTQLLTELVSHHHSSSNGLGFVLEAGGTGSFTGTGGTDLTGTLGANTTSTGGGSPFNVIQPSIVVTMMIKY